MLKAYVYAQSKIADFKDHMRDLRDDESGAAMVEYALIVGLVALAAVGVATTLGGTLSSKIGLINTKLSAIK